MSLAELGAEYRAEQDRLNTVAAARLASVFPALNLKDIDRSAPGWVYAVERVAQDHHRKSQELAADLYSSYRREAGVRNRVSFVFSDMNGGKLRASLTYEGVYAGKHMLATGQRIPEVARLLYGHTSGIALRHGQDGGRDLVRDTGRTDQATTGFGYIRMTGASPCGFCALKALGVYNSEATAGQDYHDHDKCYALPRVKEARPDGYAERMERFQGVYEESVAFKTNREGRLVIDGKQTIRNMNRMMRAGQ